jgi:signal transduction histidine kinase
VFGGHDSVSSAYIDMPGPTHSVTPEAADAAAGVRRRSSLQARLLLAYFLIGLLPMFFAAELASQVVTHAFESNLRTWLRQTAAYFLAAVVDSEREANDVVRVLAQQPDMLGNLISNKRLPLLTEQMIAGEGYDLLTITDDLGHIVYSSSPIISWRHIRLGHGIGFMEITSQSGTELMVAATGSFDYQGHQYQVMLGSWLDENFFGHLSEITSFDFRLYGQAGAGFKEIFRSSAKSPGEQTLSPAVIGAVKSTDGEYFDRHVDNNSYTGLYIALRNDVGGLDGVVLCGLRSSLSSTRWINRTSVFFIIFITGMLLSMLVGYVISRRLTRPLRSLTASVKAITAGDYRSRVEVEGRDEVAELASVFNDMAQRLEQLAELETQLRRQDRLSALGKAAAGIAHEVRNPLGTICTSAELIRNRYKLADRDQKLIENVIGEVRRIDRLVGEFLTFAKPEPMRLTAIKPAQIIAQVVHVHAPELARRKVDIEVSDESGAAVVGGDADALNQAILNVMLNAADAMPQGGKLKIGLSVVGDELLIRFADNGSGLPEEVIDRIFDPFYTTKAHGSGLGLAKVRSVLEAHQGRVDCWNAAGAGAVFEFSLPLVKQT